MDLSFLDPQGGGHNLVRHAIATLKPGDRMLDVGANTGFLTLLAARQVGPSGGGMNCSSPNRQEETNEEHILAKAD